MDAQYQPASEDLDRWLDAEFKKAGYTSSKEFMESHPQFANAHPDDIPTTGIIEDIRYPEPLAVVAHINENNIRRQLGLKPRRHY